MTNDAQELEYLKRNIDIGVLAQSQGWTHNGTKSTEKWQVYEKGCRRIVVTQASDGHYLYQYPQTGTQPQKMGGSVLDFCKTEMSLNLGQARQHLWDFSASPAAMQAAQATAAKPVARVLTSAAIAAMWANMSPYSGSYLQERGLTDETVRLFGVKQDKMGHACFRHRTLKNAEAVGWEIKDHETTLFNVGGHRSLWIQAVGTGKNPTHIFFVESAIDAMSYHQLHKKPKENEKHAYVSTGGALSPEQEQMAAKIMRVYPSATVILAHDADEAGEKMAHRIAIHAPQRSLRDRPPQGKDWNEYLQSRVPVITASGWQVTKETRDDGRDHYKVTAPTAELQSLLIRINRTLEPMKSRKAHMLFNEYGATAVIMGDKIMTGCNGRNDREPVCFDLPIDTGLTMGLPSRTLHALLDLSRQDVVTLEWLKEADSSDGLLRVPIAGSDHVVTEFYRPRPATALSCAFDRPTQQVAEHESE
jgi:hypothetical protein